LSESLVKPAVSGFLSNNLKYIYQPGNSEPVICLKLYIKIGSAWEKEDEAGFSHFMEHLTFKSTVKFPFNQIAAYISKLGGSINAYTDFDCTCYYISLPSEFVMEGLEVLAELAFHSTFTKEDVEVEKDIILEEMVQNTLDPETNFLQFVQDAAFTDYPLKRPILGTKESIKKASYKELRSFYHKYYQPHNSFLVIAGEAEFNQLKSMIEELFGDWNSHSKLIFPDFKQFLEPIFPPLPYLSKSSSQLFIAFVLPELSDKHPLSNAMLIAIRYLAIGRSSRLFKRLVEGEKLASAVKVSSISGIMTGVSAIVVYPINEKSIPRIINIFQVEYQSILQGELDLNEIELIKKDVINTWRYGFECMEDLAEMIGDEEFIEGYENLYNYDEKIEPLQLEDIKKVITQYWQPSYLQIIQQTPHPGSLSLPEKLSYKKINITSPIPELKIPASLTHPVPYKSIRPDFYSVKLANRLSLLYRYLPNRPISGFALATDICQLNEEKNQHGLNYLCSSALLHSSINYNAEEILSLYRLYGVSLKVEHSLDTTIFRGKCFHKELLPALTLLEELIFHPAFEEQYIKLLKTAAIDMLRRDKQVPYNEAFYHWFYLLFGKNSPYGRYSGNISDLKRHNLESVVNWYKTNYRPEHFSLAVIGSLEPDKFFSIAPQIFKEPAPSENWTGKNPEPPYPIKKHKIIAHKSSPQAIIHLGGFAPAAKDRVDSTAFYLLAQIIGGDMDSRLFNLVREQKGFAYQTGFEYNCAHSIGYWFAYAYCEPEVYKQCLELILQILQEVKENGVTETELLNAQNYLCGMNRFEAENASAQAMSISSLSALGYEPEYYFQREERIRSVDLKTISHLAKNWLTKDNIWIYIYL